MFLVPDSNNKPDSTVREVQVMLNSIRINFHHLWNHLTEDGIYGPSTANVVKKFQEYRGISSTMSTEGVILGDTTIEYIRQEYQSVPILSSRSSSLVPIDKNNSEDVNKPKVIFDLVTLLSNEGAPIYKKLEEAFPYAYKRLSAKSDKPLFVFSKQDANHLGPKYKRFNLPENVCRYLGYIGLVWSWYVIFEEVKKYKQKLKANDVTSGDTFKLGANIYSLCTSSVDTLLSLPVTKQLAARIGGFYSVAELGAPFSVAGVSALSTIGACIGAFLLGWEIGEIIGNIPIGNGKCVQDVINDYIDYVWEHPYKALGVSIIALTIDNWKKFVIWNVNRVSNLKPLTYSEKQKLEQYLMQHREMEMYATPPKYVITARK